jgi:hypothetical protein
MGKVIEFILHAFGKKEEPDSAEEVLLDFLSKKRGTEERASVVACGGPRVPSSWGSIPGPENYSS